MLTQALLVASLLLSAALMLCCYRLWRGPALWDRVLALDTLYITAIGLLIVQDIRLGSPVYFEVALLIAALGFVATVATAKFLLRDSVGEEGSDDGERG
jgi:multicomponent K+:H+ antiporter subunit F